MEFKHAEGIASRLFKMDADGLRQALNVDDAVDTIDEKQFIELLVSKQSEVIKDRFDRGYKKAQSETLGSLEKEIRSEFNIDSTDLKGIDLVKAVADAVREDAAKTASKSKLSEDDVKKHPLYLELEKTKKREVEDLRKEFDAKIKAEQDAREYEKTLSVVSEQAKTLFKELGEAVLPEDQAVAERIIQKMLIDELTNGRKFERNGDDFIVLKADGTRDEDKAGNAKSLKDLVAEIGKQNFQFKQSQERKAPGNGGTPPGPGSGGGKTQKYTGNAPKDAKEYVGLITSGDLSLEQKTEIKEVYGPQFANG